MWSVLGFSGFPGVISSRTGNTNVGTVSGLSTYISTLTESGLADPKPCVTGIGA